MIISIPRNEIIVTLFRSPFEEILRELINGVFVCRWWSHAFVLSSSLCRLCEFLVLTFFGKRSFESNLILWFLNQHLLGRCLPQNTNGNCLAVNSVLLRCLLTFILPLLAYCSPVCASPAEYTFSSTIAWYNPAGRCISAWFGSLPPRVFLLNVV